MSALSLTSLASRINREHEAALRDASSAIERARVVGKLLLEAKEQCERGKWKSWLSENCSDISQDTAERYMNVARHPEIEATSVRNAILKLAPPEKREPNKSARVRISQVIESEPEVSQKTHATSVLDLPKPAQLAAATAKAPAPPAKVPESPLEAALPPGIDLTDYEPDDDEAYKASIENVMMADDKLGAMRKELEEAYRQLHVMTESRNYFQTKAGEHARTIEDRNREISRLKKKLEKLQGEAKAA